MLKKEKGITLVALVITIIVLLILAGVTIAMVVGDNGILTRSRQSKFESIESEIEEKVEMAMSDLEADMQANDSNAAYTETEVCNILERTLGDGKILNKAAADGNYKITFGTTVIEKKTDSHTSAIPDTGTVNTITVEYLSGDLTKSAKKGWTGPLHYEYKMSNYLIEDQDSAAEDVNNGNY